MDSTCPCADVPFPTAIRAPRRSATVRIGESRRTRIASLVTLPRLADTTCTRARAAAAKIVGVLPVPPTSIAPARAASISGGPAVKVRHSIR